MQHRTVYDGLENLCALVPNTEIRLRERNRTAHLREFGKAAKLTRGNCIPLSFLVNSLVAGLAF